MRRSPCWRRGSASGQPARRQACRRPPGTGGTGSARRRCAQPGSRIPNGLSRRRWRRLNGRRSWECCTAHDSPTRMVATRESAILAQKLIAATCAKQHIPHGQLAIHADRGSSMTSKPVAFLLADLGITQSHSRPHVSNDNPYSESQFKTLKYRPDFPARFGLDRGRPGTLPALLPPVQPANTAIRRWACTPPPTSTTARPRPSRPPGRTCSPPPTPPTPNGSSASPRHRHDCQPPRGSTAPIRRNPTLSKSRPTVPHPG